MQDNRPLSLRIARKEDFAILSRALFSLVLLSAVLSPQPVALTLIALFLIGARWASHILCFSNVNNIELTLNICADGRVSLNTACENTVEGCLDGQQWYTQRLAVLKIATGGEAQNLLVLSGQQATDEYRRLIVWLRQGVFSRV